jgi:hypothetical protein
MADEEFSALRQRVSDLLSGTPTTDAKRAPQLLRAAPGAPAPSFSEFRVQDLQASAQLADRFRAAAEQEPGTAGLHRAVDIADGEMQRGTNPALVRHAFEVFIAKHPEAGGLPVPTLRERLTKHEAEKKTQPRLMEAMAPPRKTIAPAAAHPDAAVFYYCQDIDLNDHHRHWHIIYPAGQLASPYHGRLFAYMHQQMLARYDAERLAAKIGLVQPFGPDDWQKTVPSTPLPTWIESLFTPQTGRTIVVRPDGTGPSDFIPAQDLADHVTAQKDIDDRIASGEWSGPDALEQLSIVVEAANLNQPGADPTGGIHNAGHGKLGTYSTGSGLMTTTATAVSDPVFFRWHRRVDDFWYAWEQKQSANVFSNPPPVEIRKSLDAANTIRNASPDLILVPRTANPNPDDGSFDWRKFGDDTFGDWTKAAGAPAVDVLRTHMVHDPLAGPNVQALEIVDDWVWLLRVRRTGNAPVNVTVRVFIVPVESADNRRMWIEMDKFKTVIDKPETIVARPAWHSAVVRAKPADPAKLPETISKFDPLTPGHDPTIYCDCGLPYRLFLPRGTSQGMAFRLFVMLTDGDADQLDPDRECGSISYCGKLAGNTWTYPDKKEMGYPFSRRFPNDDIAGFIASAPNVATKDFTIVAT